MIDPAQPIRIGLWGANQAGKTTFLGALRIATLRDAVGHWRVTSDDFDSRQFMIRTTNTLNGQKQFPPTTEVITSLRWMFAGQATGGLREWLAHVIPGANDNAVTFRLEVLDCPGGIYEDDSEGFAPEQLERVIQHMSQCDALLYLFDPLRANNYSFVQRTLDDLANVCQQHRRVLQSGKLPHFVAVCITKLDDPRVFGPILSNGWIPSPLTTRVPYVTNDHARGLFRQIADDLIVGSMSNFFEADRLQYFVTSSVGFRLGTTRAVDLNDYANVHIVDGKPRIRGEIHPINVLEPVVWLEHAVRRKLEGQRAR
jgi:hypothetical protein